MIEILNKSDLQFSEVLQYIENNYKYTASAFTNGNQENAEDQNQGSAKVFAFAQLNNLSQEDTLKLFAEHYKSVLETPEGTDHNNIRQFMQNGWNGVKFENTVLTQK